MTTITAIRNQTYAHQIALVVWECPSCGIVYGIPKHFADSLRSFGPGAHYYCPNGHKLSWTESEADRQRERAERAERIASSEADTARRWRDNAERERRSAAAFKGHVTRMKNRLVNGVCPVPGCKRSGFKQVMAHIASQHADWLHEHPELSA